MKFLLNLPDDLHKKVKLIALTKGISMNQFIINCIEAEKEYADLKTIVAGLELPEISGFSKGLDKNLTFIEEGIEVKEKDNVNVIYKESKSEERNVPDKIKVLPKGLSSEQVIKKIKKYRKDDDFKPYPKNKSLGKKK